MWVQSTTDIDIIIMLVVCEAIVNLIFTGTILQPLREFLIRWTPFLTVRGDHLLSCKLCTSFWVGILCAVVYLYLYLLPVRLVVLGLFLHRMSNHLHLVFSLLRDIQLDRRIERGRSK